MFFIIGLLSAMIMEYALHRVYLHRRDHPHLVEHHKIFLETFESNNYGFKEIVSHPGYIFISSILTLGITLLWIQYDIRGLWIYFFGCLYLLWVEWAHYLYHRPKGYRFEKWAFFQMLKEHHHQHHLKFNKNYGIGATFIDHIARTKR